MEKWKDPIMQKYHNTSYFRGFEKKYSPDFYYPAFNMRIISRVIYLIDQDDLPGLLKFGSSDEWIDGCSPELLIFFLKCSQKRENVKFTELFLNSYFNYFFKYHPIGRTKKSAMDFDHTQLLHISNPESFEGSRGSTKKIPECIKPYLNAIKDVISEKLRDKNSNNKSNNNTTTSTCQNNDDENSRVFLKIKTCISCRKNFVKKDNVAILPCQHAYHEKCYNAHVLLNNNKHSCIICDD